MVGYYFLFGSMMVSSNGVNKKKGLANYVCDPTSFVGWRFFKFPGSKFGTFFDFDEAMI